MPLFPLFHSLHDRPDHGDHIPGACLPAHAQPHRLGGPGLAPAEGVHEDGGHAGAGVARRPAASLQRVADPRQQLGPREASDPEAEGVGQTQGVQVAPAHLAQPQPRVGLVRGDQGEVPDELVHQEVPHCPHVAAVGVQVPRDQPARRPQPRDHGRVLRALT